MHGDKKHQCHDGMCGAGDCYNCNPSAYREERCASCNGQFYAHELDGQRLCPDCQSKIKCDYCGEWSTFNWNGMCEDCVIDLCGAY